jgi:integrase/recombinase XerD
MEVCALKIGDIVPEARFRHDDSGRMLIHVENGKGGEECYVNFSA